MHAENAERANFADARLAQAWHNRAKGCSLVDDRDGSCLLGKPKPLFIPEDYGNNMNVCVAFNYSEYTVGSYGTEVSGPGYIDSHVPFAYDAAIAIAHAVNFNSNHLAMNKAEKGRFFHERLQNVTFDGFSGRVRFTNGDRAEETVKWSIFSFENAVLKLAYSIDIFPNPTDGIFNLKLNSQQNLNAQLLIFNIEGRKIYDENLNLDKNENKLIDLSHHKSGIYFIYLNSENKIILNKTIKIQK
mgnify:CR=1 FL=1